MSNLVLAEVGQDGPMSSLGPRASGPAPRRSFTPLQSLELLALYEDACTPRKAVSSSAQKGRTPRRSPNGASCVMHSSKAGKKAGESVKTELSVAHVYVSSSAGAGIG